MLDGVKFKEHTNGPVESKVLHRKHNDEEECTPCLDFVNEDKFH